MSLLQTAVAIIKDYLMAPKWLSDHGLGLKNTLLGFIINGNQHWLLPRHGIWTVVSEPIITKHSVALKFLTFFFPELYS